MPNLQGSTQGVNLPTTAQAAQAAVAYINHHGGFRGRPLALSVCQLLTTPASDVACSNSMVAAKPLAILGGSVDNADPIITAAAQAGIPYMTTSASAPLEVTSPDAFGFSPGNTGQSSAVAQLEKKLGGSMVNVLLLSGAGSGATQLSALNRPPFQAFGIAENVLLIPTGASDLVPSITAAAKSPATGVFLDTDPTTCLAALNSKATLGLGNSIRFYMDTSCEVSSVFQSAGANDAYFTNYGDSSNTADPDAVLYSNAMKEYAPGVSPQGYAVEGFIGIMDLYNYLERIPSGAPITSASLLTALRQSTKVPQFMGDGAVMTCDGTVFKQEPSICSNTLFLEQYSSGQGVHFVGAFKIPPGS